MEKLLFSNEETGAICASLAYLSHAGISNANALALVAEDESRPKFKKVLSEMADRADHGEYMSEVFKASGCFDNYVCELLTVGEKTGRTEEALDSLSKSCEKRASLDRQLKSALVYPSVLLLIMLAVIAVLLIYVLPIFDQVYSQLGSGLTGVAGGLLHFGRVLGNLTPLLIALFVAAVVFLALFSAVAPFREKVLNLFWKSGKDKGVAAKISTARFAQGLAMCMGSGMDVDESIEMAASLPGSDSRLAEKLAEFKMLMAAGQTMTGSVKEAGLLPAAECRMLEAGVRGGSGDMAMEQISARLTEESDAALADSISRIEPTMVIISSVLVGLILLSVMLPLINVMAAIG